MSDQANPMRGDGMFIGVQDFYSRYRPPVVDAVAEAVIARCDPDVTTGSLVDLGTGTGQVVHAFAPWFTTIYAVELDRDMLNRARADWAARPENAASPDVFWEQSDVSEWVVPSSASVSLICTCRSFHWMDQSAILARYAAMTRNGSSFAVFGDSSFWEAPAPWAIATRETVQSFLGEKRRARAGTFEHHRRPYSEIVAESPYSHVQETVVPVDRSWRPNQVLGYLYSTTFASRDLFGTRIDEFESALMERLSEFVDDEGLLSEAAEFKVVVGTKPDR